MIRPALIVDLNAIAVMWVDMVKEEFGENSTPDISNWINLFSEKMVNNEHFTMLVAENGDGIVGYISGEVFVEPANGKMTGVSHSMYVKPPYRNLGISNLLYHRFAKRLIKQGVKTISFYCNPEKISYWEKKGFTPSIILMTKEAHNIPLLFN